MVVQNEVLPCKTQQERTRPYPNNRSSSLRRTSRVEVLAPPLSLVGQNATTFPDGNVSRMRVTVRGQTNVS